jgi:hypothetical protein
VIPEREPGELSDADLALVRRLHEWLLGQSTLYAYAHEERLAGLMVRIQRDRLDEFLEYERNQCATRPELTLPSPTAT